MLNRELLDKIGSLVKIENHSQYIDEEDLRFLYNDVYLTCTIFELIEKNNIEIRRKRIDSGIIENKVLMYQKNKSINLRNSILEDCLFYIYKGCSSIAIEDNYHTEELIGYAYEGLIYSIENYTKNNKFSIITYIRNNIFFYIKKQLRNDNRMRKETNKNIQYEHLDKEKYYLLDDNIDERTIQKLHNVLSNLPKGQLEVIKMMYGFDEQDRLSVIKIAEKQNTCRQAVYRRHNRALNRIRKKLICESK